MKRLPLAAAVMLCVCMIAAAPAHARHHKKHYKQTAYSHSDPRPHAWCGWWLRQHLGVSDRSYNLARNWIRYGSSSHGPAVGAIIVWRHHVGIITGRTSSGWIIKSGNDGHAVRERERSIRGAIAFRWPNGFASAM